MAKCKDSHIQTCMLETKTNMLSRMFGPPFSHIKVLGHQDIDESFADVVELYFALLE